MSFGAGLLAVVGNNGCAGAGDMTENHESLTECEGLDELRASNAKQARAYRSRQRRGVVWA